MLASYIISYSFRAKHVVIASYVATSLSYIASSWKFKYVCITSNAMSNVCIPRIFYCCFVMA